MTIRRLVQHDYGLQDAADAQGVSMEDAARDLALLSVIASLTDNFGERIIFKGGAALAYLLWTRNRPRRRVAEGIFAILFLYTVLVLPWTFVAWCRLGRVVCLWLGPSFAWCCWPAGVWC